jgi:O-succinylbenzoate synthase
VIETLVVRLPLRRPFATAHGTATERAVLLVHVVDGDGEGWGECADDDVDAVHVALVDIVAGREAKHPAAAAAWEMALLDHRLRREGRSLREHLGGSRERVLSTATVGFEDDIDVFREAGYRSFKLKVSPQRLPATAEGMQLDANTSFASNPALLDVVDDLGALLIEQPLAVDDLDGHAALRTRLRTAICLDESLRSVDVVDDAVARDAMAFASIKPSRLGGVEQAAEAARRCAAAGVGAKVGGMLETGIGRAAALALASIDAFTLPPDLSASDRYWAEDLTDPFVLDDAGCLGVPDGPGLGITVRTDVVDRQTISRQRVDAEL